MAKAEVLLHADRPSATLELPPRHANKGIFKKRFKTKRRRRNKRAHDEVCRQIIFMSSLVPRNDLQRDTGRKTPNDLRQRWQNDTAGIVRHGETDVCLALRRRKRFSYPEARHSRQNLAQFSQKRASPRSQLVVAPPAHQ